MKLFSPLPISDCIQVLREQVGYRRQIRLCRTLTSRVVGSVSATEVDLSAGEDVFSKRFIGRLIPVAHGTLLEGNWHLPLGSRLWGDHQFDEEIVFGFLQEYGRFSKSNEK